MSRLRPRAAIASAALALVPVLCAAPAQGSTAPPSPYAPGHVLLAFRPWVPASARARIARAVGGEGLRTLGPGRRRPAHGASRIPQPMLLHVPRSQTLAAVARLRRMPEMAYAEPDYLIHADAVPNDASFAKLWGDENSGQPAPTQELPSEHETGATSGAPGADDDAVKAWSVTTGSPSIVIGEVDTGVDFNHPDLRANIWSSPWRFGPGKEPNQCAVGSHGYNVLGEQEGLKGEACDPLDRDTAYGGHGTHVAGILGAVGNNGEGVVGMNWHTTILPIRWLQNAQTSSETGKLVEALEWIAYFRERGVNIRVVNDSASFMSTEASQSLINAINKLGQLNILFVTSAGNTSQNDDSQRWYPCVLDLPNEICVTASNNRDELPSWANWGPGSVDLAAPGAGVYSTLIGGQYGYLSGGSMAAPQVAGAAALVLSVLPAGTTAAELKSRLLGAVDVLPSLAGRVITGGRLDVCKALPGCADEASASSAGTPPPPPPPAPPAPAPPPPAPVIRSLRISPHSFKAARSGRAIVATLRLGAIISYTDSEAAVASFTVLVPRHGVVRGHGACVRPPSHPQHHRYRSCTRYVPTRGTFSRNDVAGANRFHFSGHLANLRLTPGSYVLRVLPTFAGRTGSALSAGFRIVP